MFVGAMAKIFVGAMLGLSVHAIDNGVGLTLPDGLAVKKMILILTPLCQ
jgi:hypothetical protein